MRGGGPGRRPIRVRESHVSWVEQRLGDRDQAILQTLALTRLASGIQLERLHFNHNAPMSRGSVRRDVLSRLVAWRVLTTLPRRVGGTRAGSGGLVYALDSAGWQLVRSGDWDGGRSIRRVGKPSDRFVKHILGVTELYVVLTELSRTGACKVVMFQAEPYCWWPNGRDGLLKPDALVVVALQVTNVWWLEHDRDNEDLPTIRRKLLAYLDYARRGQRGPYNAIPLVLLSVPDEARRSAIDGVIRSLPEPASKLFFVEVTEQASAFLMRKLRE
jgi:hypothetical protein